MAVRYQLRVSHSPCDLGKLQAFRAQRFGLDAARDADGFDTSCRHAVVFDTRADEIAGCLRLAPFAARDIAQSCAAQFYDLTPLSGMDTVCLEIGRLCAAQGRDTAHILRLLQRAVAAEIARVGAGFLFGCTSCPGTDPARYGAAFGLLAARHVGAANRIPLQKALRTIPLSRWACDTAAAYDQMPPLLRRYLRLGAWVSDHVVIDRDLGTLHVFTGLDIASVLPAPARLLRN